VALLEQYRILLTVIGGAIIAVVYNITAGKK
jgi:hypothetical protein